MGIRRLLLLSVLLWSHSEAEVVRSVSDCREFFLHGTPPQISGVLEDGEIKDQNRYKPICQIYENRRRFFTLYDTTNKIPVFSAYKFKGNRPGISRPNIIWMTEPQLEINMQIKCDSKRVYQKQASFEDYKNKLGYDKGHIYPSSYGETREDKESTFTLTNVVPQASTFNQGSWNKMENCTKCVMKKYCINNNNRIEGFLVTGTDPGLRRLNNKINIPSAMWSAFCCYSSREQKWLASGHWGENVPDVPTDKYMETKTLNQLYLEFSPNRVFKLFSSVCPLHETVTQFYPQLNAENQYCNCPPNAPVDNSPVDKAPNENAPVDNSPVEDSPVEDSPADNAPGDNSPVDNAPDENAPIDNSPVDKAPADNAPGDNSPVDSSPEDNSPVDSSPEDNSPADNSPEDNSPADNSPEDNSPVDSSPEDNSPVDSSPEDNAPDDNEAIDNTVTTAIKTIKSYLSGAYERINSLIQQIKTRVGL